MHPKPITTICYSERFLPPPPISTDFSAAGIETTSVPCYISSNPQDSKHADGTQKHTASQHCVAAILFSRVTDLANQRS